MGLKVDLNKVQLDLHQFGPHKSRVVLNGVELKAVRRVKVDAAPAYEIMVLTLELLCDEIGPIHPGSDPQVIAPIDVIV